MSLIDIQAVKKEAQEAIQKEVSAKAVNALKAQMRVVASAEAVLRAEKLKLADIEAQIADGAL